MRAHVASASLALLATTLVARSASAAPAVWVIDDGEKVRRDATATPFERGDENPVWRPGEPVRLFAMRGESVALQVVVEADDDEMEGVTVELPALDGPEGAKLAEEPPLRRRHKSMGLPPTTSIERYVEHFVTVRRASGGKTPGESLGWERGSGPKDDEWVGPVPDALIPVDVAPTWAPYPMRIGPRSNGIVWIDVNVPRDQALGPYAGTLSVRAGDRALATMSVELTVEDATLPDRTVGTALYYDHEEIEKRVGPRTERQLWQLLHAHRITPLHDATSPQDVDRQLAALSGALYTRDQGYTGAAPATGDGLLAVGAYGALGGADDIATKKVTAIADRVADLKLLGSTDVLLYAADEECSSPWGAAWSRLLRGADDPSLRRVRVAWTCTQDPTAQPVDVPILHATYDPVRASAARAQGKETWVYNGVLPRTGSFLLDDDAVSPRVNGWLSAMYRIPRWFYWESTHWYAAHGDEPVDPFVEPEFRNDDGDWANGDGVLLYPGTQRDAFDEHSIGVEAVLPSIRLKNWRRGIEDAGYLQMARERNPARADEVARWLVPAAFGEAPGRGRPAWSSRGKPFYDARRALLAIVMGREPVALEPRPPTEGTSRMGAGAAAAVGCSPGAAEASTGGVLALAAIALGMRRRRHAT
jgi:MYXO-CTERM domain-containing protein